VAADGTVFCTDDRVFKLYNPGKANERMLILKSLCTHHTET